MVEKLNDAELEIYSRQIVLGDIGYDGQINLRNAKACIVGLGGLGNLLALKLVAMGIGYLRMVDRDIVSRSDLHRQYLYDVDAVGRPKVEAAYKRLSRLNPDVVLEPVPESLTGRNSAEVLGGVDVVLDGLDRPEPRYIINRTCYAHSLPFIFGAAIEAYGNVSTFIPGQTSCFECFMPGLKDDDLPKCGIVGVHPSILSIVTAIQASEAVNIIIGKEPKLASRLLYIDLRELEFHTLNLSGSKKCPVCGKGETVAPEPLSDKLIEETCARDGRRNFIISPAQKVEVDFDRLREVLTGQGYTIKSTGMLGVTFEQPGDITTSILKSGVMITQVPPQLEKIQKDDITGIYKAILIKGLALAQEILPQE